MDKKFVTIVAVFAAAIIAIGIGIWIMGTGHKSAAPAQQQHQVSQYPSMYRNDAYGIAFTYPSSYALSEKNADGTDLAHRITLAAADTNQPAAGEGPTAITVSIYGNPNDLSVASWIEQNPQSNYKQATSQYASATVASQAALAYSWDGLYQAKSTVFKNKDTIVMVTVTYDNPSERIVSDYNSLLSSLELNK